MKKKILAICTALSAMVLMTVTALASTPDPASASEIVGGSLPAVQSEIMAVIGVVAPVAFAIMAAILAITFGIRFVRRMIGR